MAKLFESLQLKSVKIPNRIVMPPMCQYSSDNEGMVNEWHFIHYAARAVGGTGLIILEATAVEPRGRISSRDLGIWSDEHVPGLKRIVEVCKGYGAVVGIQLAHAGRKSKALGSRPVAPSPIPFSGEYQTPLEIKQEEMDEIVEKFRMGALRAHQAGFDLIEIHSAHGYLLNQFLSPLTNRRKDIYGGPPENRVRLLNRVIKAVREVWPGDKPLCVRISAEEYHSEGNQPRDVVTLLNLLEEKPDIYHVSSGGVTDVLPPAYPGYQVRYSEIIREGTGKPTIAGGLVTHPAMAEEILQNERADLVFLGRELLRNPYWPLYAARQFNHEVDWPEQYQRAKV